MVNLRDASTLAFNASTVGLNWGLGLRDASILVFVISTPGFIGCRGPRTGSLCGWRMVTRSLVVGSMTVVPPGETDGGEYRTGGLMCAGEYWTGGLVSVAEGDSEVLVPKLKLFLVPGRS